MLQQIENYYDFLSYFPFSSREDTIALFELHSYFSEAEKLFLSVSESRIGNQRPTGTPDFGETQSLGNT